MTLPELRFSPQERADLHLHSTWSDGTLTPEQLAAACAAAGLSVVALCDHAELRGIAPTALAGARLGVYVVPAVELNAAEADLLGYFVDAQAPALVKLCGDLRQRRAERTRAAADRLQRLGLGVPWEEVERVAGPAAPMRTHLARVLVARGRAASVDVAFRDLLGRQGAAWVSGRPPSAAECVDAIHAAGGVVAVAHPHFAAQTPLALDRLLADLAQLGVVGCEQWRAGADAPPAAIQRALAGAVRAHGLLPLQGTDFHGPPVDARRPGLRTVGGHRVRQLNDRVPGAALHRSLFKRMHWRAHNLRPDELRSSLSPDIVQLESLHHEHLLARPPPAATAPPGFAGCPFVLVRAGALQRVEQVVRAIEGAGGQVVARREADGYPELAWDLYDLGPGPDPARARRSLLNFGLDRHLYGPDGERCLLLFFRGPLSCSFRSLKIDLRRSLGRIRFHRVRCGSLEDTCLTTYVHMPEQEHVALECWRLVQCGVEVPASGGGD